LFDESGVEISSMQRALPAGQQIAQLGSELFQSTQFKSAWVRGKSDADGITGAWMAGDVSGFGGANSPPSGTQLALPILNDAAPLNIASTTESAAAVEIEL